MFNFDFDDDFWIDYFGEDVDPEEIMVYGLHLLALTGVLFFIIIMLFLIIDFI